MTTIMLLAFIIVWQAYLTYLLIRVKKQKDINASKEEYFSAGLSKFNPFGNVGGNQSFCLALLMRKNLGIILTSLHGRNGTRVYAREFNVKTIDRKRLSSEESEAIKKALKIEENNEK